MNRHIELVEKWLSDNSSVSLEELRANRDAAAADAASYASYAAAADAADAAADAADASYASYAAYAAEYVDDAEYYVKRYKELTKEDVCQG